MDYGKIRVFSPKKKSFKTVDIGRIVPCRKVIDGILYVVRTRGCQWKMIPKEYVLVLLPA